MNEPEFLKQLINYLVLLCSGDSQTESCGECDCLSDCEERKKDVVLHHIGADLAERLLCDVNFSIKFYLAGDRSVRLPSHSVTDQIKQACLARSRSTHNERSGTWHGESGDTLEDLQLGLDRLLARPLLLCLDNRKANVFPSELDGQFVDFNCLFSVFLQGLGLLLYPRSILDVLS